MWAALAALLVVAGAVALSVPVSARAAQPTPTPTPKPLVSTPPRPFLSEGSTPVAAQVQAAVAPSGFQDTTVFSGLTLPTAVRFAPDGRVFVAEKSGLIKVFGSLTDTTPTIFADLRAEGRQLLGSRPARDDPRPELPDQPRTSTSSTPTTRRSAARRRVWNDACPTPPGPTTDGCVISGRLSRLQATGNVMTGTEQVLINDWCQQFPSHSVGDLRFGADGALYVSGGDGASFGGVDYGQFGGGSGSPTPANPCGDPPGRRRRRR